MATLTLAERTFTIGDNFVSMVDDSITDTTGTDTTGTDTTGTGTTGTGTTADAVKVTELIISGTGEVGKKLTSNATNLYDKDGIGSLTYQWKIQGTDIPKATKETYTITKTDYGKSITLKVSYTNLYGKVVKESNTIIALIFTSTPTSTTLTNQLKISGVPEIGKVLTADVTQLYDQFDMGPLTYQWQAQGVNILNATKKTYTIVKADYGKTIKLKVSYMNKKAITVVKESNELVVMHGTFINDIVEFKLSWETLFVPKTILPKNTTTYEKLDAILLVYDITGNLIKQIKSSDSTLLTTKTSTLDSVGSLPTYATTDKDNNVKSSVITYQVDFSKLDKKYNKLVYCVCEVTTPPNVSIAPTDLYPRVNWADSADLTKKISILGTVSPFKTVFNNKGLFVLDINTLGTTKYPKSIISFGEEARIHSASTDTKERLCVFCVFTRSPDNNGWYVEKQYKLKTQLKGVKPLDYLVPPLSKYTDLGI
jgi:hypothetical protein